MDYRKLAAEYIKNMQLPGKVQGHRHFFSAKSNYIILMHIEQKKEALPKDISSSLNVSSARVAAALNTLEKDRLITRNVDESDRRRTIIRLTEKGSATVAEKKETGINKIAQLFESLGKHDTLEYLRITQRIIQIVKDKGCLKN